MTEAVELEALSEAILDHRGGEHGFACISDAEDARAPEIAITQQISGGVSDDHSRSDRPSRARPKRDERARRDAGGGPKHRDPVGLREERKAQPRRGEIGDADQQGERPWRRGDPAPGHARTLQPNIPRHTHPSPYPDLLMA